jgi:hypothetical protein
MMDMVSHITEDGKAKHCKKFQRLHKTQHPPLPPDNRKIVINLSKVPLEEAACSALSKGLNYAVALAVLPVEDMVGQSDEKSDSVAFLPYVGSIFNRINRVLARHNIKSVGLPPRKISSFLQPVKDDLGLKTPGVYSIPCECGQV